MIKPDEFSKGYINGLLFSYRQLLVLQRNDLLTWLIKESTKYRKMMSGVEDSGLKSEYNGYLTGLATAHGFVKHYPYAEAYEKLYEKLKLLGVSESLLGQRNW